MEGHPEEYHHSIHEHQAYDTLYGLTLAQLLLIAALNLSPIALLDIQHLLESGLETIVDTDGDNKGNASHGKGKVIRVLLADTKGLL